MSASFVPQILFNAVFLVIYMPIYQQQINVGDGCKQVLDKKLAAGLKPSFGM